ncbi:unnamed protein product [Cladocopium goreaui]|uniref:Photosystem II Psb31 protein domain-containing protein n=1 Tax=Cladocopium goreaui TaxID=2562237 RepID=A0A9P1DAI2_9DINO|nr:unnamed protein product [Cladocopium goreaui]
MAFCQAQLKVAAGLRASAPAQAKDEHESRRGVLQVGAMLLGGSQPSWASLDGVPDVGDLYAGRKRYAPKIVDGYKSLKASGAVEDDWLSNLPKMRKAMDKWGALQRQDVVPDKISRTLLKDSAAFEKAAKTKDFSSTMKAFQAYLEDLPTAGPGGSGKLNLSDPLAPP